jgi:hypothetical protein
MTIKHTFCDHCGKQIDSMTDYTEMGVSLGKNFAETDLCTECNTKLWAVITDFIYNKREEINNENKVG